METVSKTTLADVDCVKERIGRRGQCLIQCIGSRGSCQRLYWNSGIVSKSILVVRDCVQERIVRRGLCQRRIGR